MKLIFSLTAFIFLSSQLLAGDTLRVLFIGNSYTYVNDLPNIIKNMAIADGNFLIHSSSTPGGQTLQQHCSNATTLNLIRQSNWDYVVVQEQSQVPSFPDGQVNTQFYPYAKKLVDSIRTYNPCSKTLFYVTWGRKNGDAQNCPNFTPLCTYEGMDDLLTLRYSNIADTVNAALSPVGPLWRQLRTDYPALDLYSSDESHPSAAGSYAAACSFYAVLFKRPVATINYNFSINATDAATIRTVAQQVVYDNLSYWQRFEPQTTSDFTAQPQVGTTNVQFSNLVENASSVKWNFGDDTESTTENPLHTYAQPGDYTVCLTAYLGQNCDSVTTCKTVTIAELGLNTTVFNSAIVLYPNPTTDLVTIKGALTNGTYEIVDVLGNKVQQGNLKTDKTTVQVQALKTGVYFIFIQSAEGKQQLRLVKK